MSNQNKKQLWGAEFLLKKKRFYDTVEWTTVRDRIRVRDRCKCKRCGQLITDMQNNSVVDHIKELTPDNFNDWNIRLNPENLQLLCKTCHNVKTFGKRHGFDLDNREDVNLF